MYQIEVRFDRELRPDLEVEAPRVLASTFDEASGDSYDFLRGEGDELRRADIAGNACEQERLVRLGRGFDEVWADSWRAQTSLASEPTPLLDGDTHCGHTDLPPGERAGVLDGQLMMGGQWARDVGDVMIPALDIETLERLGR